MLLQNSNFTTLQIIFSSYCTYKAARMSTITTTLDEHRTGIIIVRPPIPHPVYQSHYCFNNPFLAASRLAAWWKATHIIGHPTSSTLLK